MLVAVIGINCLLLILGGVGFFNAVTTGIFVALPLAVNFGLIHVYQKPKSNLEFVLLTSLLFAYITNVVVALLVIIMFTPGILKTGGLGLEVFYWGLFTLGGAFKYSFIGLIIGAIVSSIYVALRKRSI